MICTVQNYRLLPVAIALPLITIALTILLRDSETSESLTPEYEVGHLHDRLIDCNGCNAYLCHEKTAKCGPNGYLLHFGYKNCKIFTDPKTWKKFHKKGEDFVKCSTDCLINRLDKLFEKKTPTCTEIHDSSFKSHVDCYLECNFCEVCRTEKMGFLRSYDFRDFLSIDAVRQVTTILKKCGLLTCLF